MRHFKSRNLRRKKGEDICSYRRQRVFNEFLYTL